jgi:subtilisin-like proprotein convertase family protein
VLTLTNTALRLHNVTLNGGNLNGLLDPNECSLLDVVLTNVSPDAVSGITASLETKAPAIAIVQPLSAYPNIAAGGKGTNILSFQIEASKTFICDTNTEFTLRLSTGQKGTFSIPIVLPASGIKGAPLAFTSSSPVAVPDLRTTNSPLSVSGIDRPLAKATVSCHITHPNAGQLEIALIAPDGTRIDLVSQNGAPGANYGSSCAIAGQTSFDDEASDPLASGTPPFTGVFRPDGRLAELRGFLGNRVNGEWQLAVSDRVSGASGTLECWSLTLYPAVCSGSGGPCELCPDRTVLGSISRDDPAQLGRLNRDSTNSVCVSSKVCPGILSETNSLRYDAYPFQNGESNACITVSVTAPCVLFCAAYLDSFNPTNICENYLADTGFSAFEGSLRAVHFRCLPMRASSSWSAKSSPTRPVPINCRSTGKLSSHFEYHQDRGRFRHAGLVHFRVRLQA